MIDPRELRGYLRGTVMVLINLDTKQDLVLESKTIDDALDEVLKAAHWEVREPIVSVDSHLS